MNKKDILLIIGLVVFVLVVSWIGYVDMKEYASERHNQYRWNFPSDKCDYGLTEVWECSSFNRYCDFISCSNMTLNEALQE